MSKVNKESVNNAQLEDIAQDYVVNPGVFKREENKVKVFNPSGIHVGYTYTKDGRQYFEDLAEEEPLDFGWIDWRIVPEPVIREIRTTPKQTLLEAFDNYDNKQTWTPSRRDDMEFLSEYLEGLK